MIVSNDLPEVGVWQRVEMIHKDEVVQAAINSFCANHKLAEDYPDTYPHIISCRGYYDIERDHAVVEYTVDNGHFVDVRSNLYTAQELGF